MNLYKNNNLEVDLKWMFILSIIIHFLVFHYLHIEQKPVVKKLDVELIMELVKPKPVVKQPAPPPKPKPVVKQPAPPPKQIIKEPEPIIDQTPLPIDDVIPIEKPILDSREPIIDPVHEAKIIEDYGHLLTSHISQFKRYPRIALRRGWEGQLTLEVRLDKSANILNISILNKSKYDILDKEAIKMIERAKPLPKPKNLKSDTFTVFIPIKFGLK